MKNLTSLFLACCLLISPWAVADSNNDAPADLCHPAAKAGVAQYVIGYGSLMEDTSRQRSAAKAIEVVPVRVQGFQRAWIVRGSTTGFSATYLGVLPDAKSTMNAALFAVQDEADFASMDARERGYCRVRVSKSQIDTLDLSAVPEGEIWLYASKPQNIARPAADYPIVQSYVDVFLNGCLQIEDKFQLDGFARECVSSTHGWSAHWVNDRIYPRRAFVYQPRAGAIDRILSQEVPVYFRAIHIE